VAANVLRVPNVVVEPKGVIGRCLVNKFKLSVDEAAEEKPEFRKVGALCIF
jgi:hypothetical protein